MLWGWLQKSAALAKGVPSIDWDFLDKLEARRLHNALVKKFGLSLNIPTMDFVHSEGPWSVTIPYLKPSDIFTTLISKQPWMLLGGGSGVAAKEVLRTFWNCYEAEHPSHEVFQFRDRLERTIPVTLHGDGGRTQKKQPLEIFSMQPVLGLNTRNSTVSMNCRCETSVRSGNGNPGDPMSQFLNSKHSTYLTHFLIFAYPSKKYKDFQYLLHALLEAACSDLGALCSEGVNGFDGERWYPACIGFKLDMEWMAKVGSLTRSYQNVGHVRSIPCCHECDAGSVHVPFEDVNDDALWTTTCFRTTPWSTPPPWRHIPFDNAKPAKFLRRDAFHIFRMGIGRNFIASVVYLLCYMNCQLIALGYALFLFPTQRKGHA